MDLIRRSSLLCLLALAVTGVPAVEGHRFEGIGIYKYELVQDVTWTSAGDQLAYRSEMRWELSLIGLGPGTDGGQLVEARILQVDAIHRGPGSEHVVHAGGSRPAVGHEDPLLGNLLALVDVPLHLLVDPATGKVRQVEGHQAIIDRLVAQHPGPPGSPSPIAAQAAAAYSPERLARLWSTILMLPGQGEQRSPLEDPLSGEAIRRWEGNRYHLSLAPDQSAQAVLHTSPGTVELGIKDFSGGGSVTLVDGVLQAAEGTIEARLHGTAMSQDLRQQHRIRWTLARLALQIPTPPGPGPGPDASPELDGDPGDSGDSP